jgi:hypothetical protein
MWGRRYALMLNTSVSVDPIVDAARAKRRGVPLKVLNVREAGTRSVADLNWCSRGGCPRTTPKTYERYFSWNGNLILIPIMLLMLCGRAGKGENILLQGIENRRPRLPLMLVSSDISYIRCTIRSAMTGRRGSHFDFDLPRDGSDPVFKALQS